MPIAYSGRTTLLPGYEDLNQWPLYRYFIKESLLRGYFPLWCEGLYSGLDFAGWGHGSAFYPLVFWFAWFDFPTAATINQFFHLVVAIFGFYFLGRTIRLSKASSFLASAGFGFAYFLPSMVENFLPDIFATTFSPWFYAFSVRLVREKRVRSFLAFSLAAGVQLLSGHMELVVLQYLCALVFLVALSLGERDKISGLILWMLSLGFGIILGMLAYLPTFASYSQSFRKLPLSYGLFTFFPAHFYTEGLPLLALLASLLLLAVILAGLRKRGPVFWALAVMLVFVLAQSFNWFHFLWVFYQLPVLNRFIPHGRAMTQAILALFLLAGLGLDSLPSMLEKKNARICVSALIFLEAVFLLALALGIPRYFPFANPDLQHAFKSFLLSRKVGAALLLLPGVVSVFFIFKSRGRFLNAFTALGAALLLEFCLTGYFLVPRHDRNVMAPNPDYQKFVAAIKPADWRIQSVYSYDQWERLAIPLQTGVLLGTRATDAYITFSTLRYTEFLQLLDKNAFRLKDHKVQDIETLNILKRGDFLSNEKLPLINLLNLRYTAGLNKNLKFASPYFIGYESYRFKPSQNVRQLKSLKDLAVHDPAEFGLELYITPGDELELQFPPKQKFDHAEVKVLFSADRAEPEELLSKMVKPGEDLKLSLAPIETKTGQLIFRFAPHRLDSGMKPSDQDRDRAALIVRPMINNPAKHFHRLEYSSIDIFENLTALPRAFIVHGVKALPEKESRLAYLGSSDFAPEATAVLEKKSYLPFPQKMPAAIGEGAKITSADDFSAATSMVAANRSPAVLVISESYYPGFRAWVDGAETRIMPVDHAFQGIILPSPGIHKIEKKYSPVSFEFALWLELAVPWIVLLHILNAAGLDYFFASERIFSKSSITCSILYGLASTPLNPYEE